MHKAITLVERGKREELRQPGSPIPEPPSAALQMILALLAAPLGNSASMEHALGTGSLWEAKWEMMD